MGFFVLFPSHGSRAATIVFVIDLAKYRGVNLIVPRLYL